MPSMGILKEAVAADGIVTQQFFGLKIGERWKAWATKLE